MSKLAASAVVGGRRSSELFTGSPVWAGLRPFLKSG